MSQLTPKEVSHLKYGFSRIEAIRSIKIQPEQKSVLWQSIFTECLIHLRDIDEKAKKHGFALAEDADILKKNGINTIRDLIKFGRDAFCHIHIPNNAFSSDGNAFSMNVFIGKKDFKWNESDYSSDYTDDVALFIGEQRIYFYRHLINYYVKMRKFMESLYQELNPDV